MSTTLLPDCPVCFEPMPTDHSYALYVCGHVFHPPCILRWLKGSRRMCPVCREGVGEDVLRDLEAPSPPPPDDEIWLSDETPVPSPPTPTPPPPPPAVPTRELLWQTTHSRLVEDEYPLDHSDTDDDGTSGELTPAYYSSTLDFLKRLDLSEAEYAEIVFFKRCHGKYALCDAVNRLKVFLSLNDNFRFTGVHDMLHTCRREKKSASILDRIVSKYLRAADVSTGRGRPTRSGRGTAYEFFDLPHPSVRNTHTMEFERAFRRTIFQVFGVHYHLRTVRRDAKLLRFYRDNPHNLHDVLRYAALRQEERSARERLDRMEEGTLRCRRRRFAL